MFNFFIDGFEFETPEGVKDLKERLFYNDEIAIYYYQLQGELILNGDAYNYLRGLFDSSICSKSDVELRNEETGETYTGVVLINDIEWNLSKRLATINLISDKYAELIRNNQNIKVQLGVGLSKNQTPITTTSDDVDFLNINATSFISRDNCFRIINVFKELVEFMTDGEITVVSDYFTQTGVIDNPSYGYILTGKHLRADEDETPLISYEEFFTDMNRLHNLAGIIEGDTLRIEPKSYFRQNDSSVILENVNEVKQTTDRSKFYGSIRMGSFKVADGYDYLIRLSYAGFQQEQFFVEGQCNNYSELDLRLDKLVTDTNIIQDIQPVSNSGTDNDEYDGEIILVKTYPNDVTEITDAPLAPGNYYYNNFYTNARVGERWSDTYLFSVVQLLESVEQLVFANLTNDQTDSTTPSSVWFSPDDDSTPPYFDTNGDYQIGSIPLTTTYTDTVGYFEAPSDMVVTMDIDFYLTGAYWYTQVKHVDSSGNTLSSPVDIDINPNVTISQQYHYFNYRQILGSATFYMPSGSRLFIEIRALTGTVLHAGGKLSIYQLGTFGGVYEIINQDTAISSVVEFDYPTDLASWSSIKNEPFKKLNATFVDGSVAGWISETERNILTGDASYVIYQRKGDVNNG